MSAASVGAVRAVSEPVARPVSIPAAPATSIPVMEAPGQVSTAGISDLAASIAQKFKPGGRHLYVAAGIMAAIAVSSGGYWAWNKKKEADARARQAEMIRAAEAKRKEEDAARKEQGMRQKQKEADDRRQRAERQAEARAAAETQARENARSAAPAKGPTGYDAAAAAARGGDYRTAHAACQGPAQAGDVRCQAFMGLMYVNGQVGTRSASDLKIAAGWFTRAAEQNLAPAQFNLALMYERGLGVPRDLGAAKEWYRRAAVQGHPKAAEGLMRLGGPGR
jgi:hypothetical protein